MKNKWSWIVGGLLMSAFGFLIVWILNLFTNGSFSNFPFESILEIKLFLASQFIFGALMGLIYSNSASNNEPNRKSSTRLTNMSNFNINLHNLKYILPILIIIVASVFLRINFNISILLDTLIIALIIAIIYKIPWFKVSNAEYQQVNEQKQKTFLLIFLPIIALLIALPVLYGPFVENFLINTLHINPETALDSIRSFFGIHIQQ